MRFQSIIKAFSMRFWFFGRRSISGRTGKSKNNFGVRNQGRLRDKPFVFFFLLFIEKTGINLPVLECMKNVITGYFRRNKHV
jgi:hypothetical protein